MTSVLLLHGALYIFAGIFAGLMSGLLGIGGGLVVVPALLLLFRHNSEIPAQLSMHIAAGTSLAVMMFTSQASIRAHYKLEVILWSVYRRLAGGIIVGTALGGIGAKFIPTTWLIVLLIIFLLVVAFKMLFNPEVKVARDNFPNRTINAIVSFIIGFKSGLLGVGGGLLIIPYLTYCGIELRKIAPISSLCTMTVSVIGTITFILTGLNEVNLPPYSTGFVYWLAVVCVAIPSALVAPWGARLTYVLPTKQLRYVFIAILLLTVVDLIRNI
jgi:uncharacterized membrane protein YfcA